MSKTSLPPAAQLGAAMRVTALVESWKRLTPTLSRQDTPKAQAFFNGMDKFWQRQLARHPHPGEVRIVSRDDMLHFADGWISTSYRILTHGLKNYRPMRKLALTEDGETQLRQWIREETSQLPDAAGLKPTLSADTLWHVGVMGASLYELIITDSLGVTLNLASPSDDFDIGKIPPALEELWVYLGERPNIVLIDDGTEMST